MTQILKIIGKKGTKEILYHLEIDEGQYYSDLEEELNINSRTLTRRLNEMEEEGLIDRDLLEDRRVKYTLTSEGEKVREKVKELVDIA
ncbi:MAG: winged helix-turn-helix transcriptional regulator [Candidatus Aenigmatarchaeota archaeon]